MLAARRPAATIASSATSIAAWPRCMSVIASSTETFRRQPDASTVGSDGQTLHGGVCVNSRHHEDLVRIVFTIESAGEALLAVFHSHPRSAAVPSPTDVREARYEAVHLIATLADPGGDAADALRGWIVKDGAVSEVAIRISA